MSAMTAEASGTPTRSKYDCLIAAALKVPAVPTLVVHPCDESSLRGAVDAAEAGIIKPILVGPADKVRDTAAKHSLNIASYEIVDPRHGEAAAAISSSPLQDPAMARPPRSAYSSDRTLT